MVGKTLKFEDGAVQFRQRLITSILSHRSILIRNIRSDDVIQPGLHEHEASFLRLLDRMTNGTIVEINATGTQLRFKPGVLLGGSVEHECPNSRAIGWFLEGILPLAPFGKEALDVSFTGITHGTAELDPTPDYIAASLLPLLLNFGVGVDADESPPPSCRVTKRGAYPEGQGTVQFFCPIVKEIKPIDLVEVGKIKRVRGTAVSCKISPSSPTRVAHAAKGLLHRLLPDVWIHTDVHSSRKGNGCGPSPGLSLCLSAESTTGVVYTVECNLDTKHKRGAELPEDLGIKGAAMLLHEIQLGGCIDSSAQSLALLLMCLGPEDVSRIRVGTLSQFAIGSLRLFKEAFGVEFKVRADQESKTVLLSCLGTGFRNMAKAST